MIVGFVQVWLSRAEPGNFCKWKFLGKLLVTLYRTFFYVVNYEIQQAHFQKCSMFTKLSKEFCFLHNSSTLGFSYILAQSSVKIRCLVKLDFFASICNPRRIFPAFQLNFSTKDFGKSSMLYLRCRRWLKQNLLHTYIYDEMRDCARRRHGFISINF